MLSVLGWTLAWILVLTGVVLVAVLSIPVRISADLNTEREPKLRAKIAIVGGLIPIPISSSSRSEKQESAEHKPKHKHKKKTKTASLRRIIKAGPRLIAQLFSRIKFERLSANIAYGFRDPSETGVLFGMLSPLTYGVGFLRRSDIVLRPNFDAAAFDGTAKASLRFTPIAMLPPLIEFAWSAYLGPNLARAVR